ncbi:MAG TPA: hypothetical protein GXZ60_10445 [Intrasporangiaceae bacterium]|nr:hypothetical protein [Intrasporangiaceae bacterium]
MTPAHSSRRIRARRGALALAQAGLSGLLIGGVAWAGTQSVVVDLADGIVLTRPATTAFEPRSTVVAVERAVLTCPGQALLGLPGARDLEVETGALVVAAPGEVVADLPTPHGSPALGISPLAERADRESDGGTSPAVGSLVGAEAYAAAGAGTAAPGLVASQESRADTDEVRGLATVACQQAAPTAWLLGGGAGAGRAERLVISNPGSNPVTATVTVYGAEGRSQPPDGQDVVVPARGRTVLLADALAPDEPSAGFAVTVDGGEVVAVLVETVIEGTVPLGFDIVPAAQQPEPEQVIPAVLVPQQGSGSVVLRIVNPGSSDAIGTVSVLTAAGELALPDAVVRVPAGSVVDMPIDDAPPGPVSLVVTADTPIVAAARTVVQDADGADAGWAVAQAPIAGWAGAAIPARDDTVRRLVLSARGPGSEVEIVERRGEESIRNVVLVPSDGTVVVPLDADAVWVRTVAESAAVVGALLSTASEGATPAVSVLPLIAPPMLAHRSDVIPLG